MLTILASLIFAAFWGALMSYGMGMSGGSSSVSGFSEFIMIVPFFYLVLISALSCFSFRLWSYLAVCGTVTGLALFSLALPHDGASNEKGIVTAITLALPAMWALLYFFFFAFESEDSEDSEADPDGVVNDITAAPPCRD